MPKTISFLLIKHNERHKYAHKAKIKNAKKKLQVNTPPTRTSVLLTDYNTIIAIAYAKIPIA